ncbi:MAG TPA: AraC family transcriptional regulator [Bryobacteraceae bacterium]|jgi:AraC-like DNA-binding protein|nr:AraC family transcriptional regulator [Bryobacteraceae bacterium]
MFFLAHTPRAPLRRYVRALWYCRAPQIEYPRERILPSGCAQFVFALSRHYLLDVSEAGEERCAAPALLVGQRSSYEIVATSDFAGLIGVVFEPAVLPALVMDRADLFSERNIPLEDFWGCKATALLEKLREVSQPELALECLAQFLLAEFVPRLQQARFALHPAVEFALEQFRSAPSVAAIADVARRTGWSQRRFSQIFREQVGFRPKAWCRIARFQRAVQQLHAGREIRWAEVAAECGFYDQSHLANEFRAFSGINLSSYQSAQPRKWANHLPTA